MEHMTAAQPNAGLYIQRFSADDAAICRLNNGSRTARRCAETFGWRFARQACAEVLAL